MVVLVWRDEGVMSLITTAQTQIDSLDNRLAVKKHRAGLADNKAMRLLSVGIVGDSVRQDSQSIETIQLSFRLPHTNRLGRGFAQETDSHSVARPHVA